jgi:hypothetical protein
MHTPMDTDEMVYSKLSTEPLKNTHTGDSQMIYKSYLHIIQCFSACGQ